MNANHDPIEGGCTATYAGCACHLPADHPADVDHACDPDRCGGRWTHDGIPVRYPGIREDGSAGLTEDEARERVAQKMAEALAPAFALIGVLYGDDEDEDRG